MELIVQITSREALDAALEAEVSGVTINLPPDPGEAWWGETTAWRTAARLRGVRFYLQWDRLIREKDLPRAQEILAAVAALNPDALVLRDLGLCRAARNSHPGLMLHAAEACGYHNSPGLRQAEALGFSRVVLAGPLNLTDLALMRRQTALPLELVLPQPCPAFAHLCLLDEYLGSGCPSICHPSGEPPEAVAGLLAALELLPRLSQLGATAVRLGGVFSQGRPLSRLIELCRLLADASPAGRPRVLAAAREVLEAFGAELRLEFPSKEPRAIKEPPAAAPAGPTSRPREARPRTTPGSSRVWLEARGYDEAAALAQDWREPLILALTQENYAAFLGEYRHWQPRRLIWRLPPVLRESALSFFQQAVATLQQGGFSRFLAGDWGAVGLVREAGGEIYGEQTLGVRNSQAVAAARELGASRVCLPPGRGPQDWQDLVMASPRGSFWTHLFHLPVLNISPRAEVPAGRESGPAGEKLRWLSEGDLDLLCPEAPEHLEQYRDWFEQYWVSPLVVSLPHSGQPWGQVPALARPPQPAPRPRPRRPEPGPRPPTRSPHKGKVKKRGPV